MIWAELNPRLKNATWYFSVPKSLMKGIPLFIPNSLRSKAMVAFDLADACPVVSPICNSNQQQGCQCWESDVTSQFGSCVAHKKRAPGYSHDLPSPWGANSRPIRDTSRGISVQRATTAQKVNSINTPNRTVSASVISML